MNTEYIKAFISIYNSKNISAAAQRMFLTQSTLSRQVKSLESELGVTLFERGKGQGSLMPTPYATRFLPIAQQMLSLEEQAFRLREETVEARLSIGVPDSIARYAMKDFFRELVRSEKKWDISINIGDSKPICEMVMDGRLDLGIINGEDRHPELEEKLIYEEPFVVLGRSAVPTVKISDLDPAHQIFYHCGREFDAWHDLTWKSWQAKMNVNQAGLAVDCLIEEEDWTILPESTARALLPPGAFISYFEDKLPSRKVYIIWRKGLSKLQMKRVQKVYEMAQKMQNTSRGASANTI